MHLIATKYFKYFKTTQILNFRKRQKPQGAFSLKHVCITIITDYGSGVWGLRSYPEIEAVPKRTYLRIPKYCQWMAIHGEMGFIRSVIRWMLDTFRLWNHFAARGVIRPPRRIFDVEYNDMETIFIQVNNHGAYSKRVNSKINWWAYTINSF